MAQNHETEKTTAPHVILFRNRTQELVTTALMIALTYVATWLINVSKKTGALAGGIGMGLFDLLSGWTAWAPFTLIIVGFMGFEVGLFAQKRPFRNVFVNDTVSMVLALGIKIVGYYFAEVILYGNWITPLGSVPGNILQVAVAAVIVLALLPILRRVTRRAYAVAV